MIISGKDAADRLNSPLNLINRLRNSAPRSGGAMGIFTGRNGKDSTSPSSTPVNQSTNSIPSSVTTASEIKTFNPFPKTETALIPSASIPAPPATAPVNQSEETNLDNLLEDNQANIKLALAHNNAVSLLGEAITTLSTKLENVKADNLPRVIAAASRTIEAIRRERSEATKQNKGKEVHYHFYTPVQKKLEDYNIIEVEGTVERGLHESNSHG